MSRSGYVDDFDNHYDLALYRGRVASAVRGKRGQALLRTLLKALDEMPVKRLIKDELVDPVGEVCLLGAGGKAMGMPDLDKLDPEDHKLMSDRFNVAPCLIAEIEYVNDEGCYRLGGETPEQRYTRVRKWLTEQIKPDATPSASGEGKGGKDE